MKAEHTGNSAMPWFIRCCAIAATVCWPVAVLSQQAPGEDDTVTRPGEPEAFDFPVSDNETHSRRDANDSFLQEVSQHPEKFIGRMLKLENGRPVGEVLDVRRKLDNLYAYFIVDATVYFNSPTTYAIPVREVEGMQGDDIVMEMGEGMHVKGLTYYPRDYTSVDDHFPQRRKESRDN